MSQAADPITHAQAERHEALWLSLTALHKDIAALGAKKPDSSVSDPVRIAAEGLLSDCAPFIRQRREKLPVAARDLAGLAVQLGQALAALDAFESRHTFVDARFDCLMWQVGGRPLPVMRLKPPAAALPPPRRNMSEMREKLEKLIEQRRRAAYQEGYAAGLAARQGAPAPQLQSSAPAPQPESGSAPELDAPEPQTYPRLRRLD